MKRWLTLSSVCLAAISMVMAADLPTKRLVAAPMAQTQLSESPETPVREVTFNKKLREDIRPSATATKQNAVVPVKKLSKQAWTAPVQLSGRDLTALSKEKKQPIRRSAAALSSWGAEGNYDTSWFDNSQEEYILTTPEQLAGLSILTDQGHDFINVTIRLGADIDLSAHEWIPIGLYTPFAGTFDGCGHTISGMRVPFTSYAGLFATISGGEIRNVALSSDCEVNGSISGSLVGIAGSGTVENCVSEAAVSGQTAGGLIGDAGSTSVRACVFNGSVEAKELSPWYGTFSGTIADSVSVEGTQAVQMTIMPNGTDPNSVSISFIGFQDVEYSILGTIDSDGILHISTNQYIGYAYNYYFFLYGVTMEYKLVDGVEFIGTLSDDGQSLTISSSSTTDILFAILGSEDLENLYVIELYPVPFSIQKQAVELRSGALAGNGGVGFSDCYYRDDCAAGATQINGTAQTAAEMQSPALVDTMNEAVAKLVGSDLQKRLNLWTAGASCPVLSEETYQAPSWGVEGNYDTSWYSGTADVYELTTPAQLAGLAQLVADGIDFQYCTIKLGADMDLSALQWVPIGTINTLFSGVFDGAGHTIDGLNVPQHSYAGLFGVVQNADIRNLTLSSTCEIHGFVAGSIAGQMTYSSILNCRSDATVYGNTGGGLVGGVYNSSLAASIFNGQVFLQTSESEWVGTYAASAGSPFEGQEDTVWNFDITIAATDTPDEYTIAWTSPSAGFDIVLTGALEADGKLHIPLQYMANIGGYDIYLEGITTSSGEFVATLSEDKTTITFSHTDPSEYIMGFAAYAQGEFLGYYDAYVLPFDAVRQEVTTQLGGLAGTMDRTFVENSYYRQGCLPADYEDTEHALAQDALLSASSVTSLNECVAGIVAGDPQITSLNRWQMGANGPELGEAVEVSSNWWTSAGNYDISWYDESKNEFTLSTPAQLAGLAYLVNNFQPLSGKTVTLANDIDLAGHLWVPIGRNSRNVQSVAIFAGIFDGGGHTIHNMTVNTKHYSYAQTFNTAANGLFGFTSGELRNVTIAEDCSIQVATAGSQFIYAGGICGVLNGGLIDNCHNRANIEARNFGGSTYVAGVAGLDNSYMPVYNSSNSGNIVAESEYGEICASGLVAVNAYVVNGYNTGAVSAQGPTVYVGGISADYARLRNVYNAGAITATGTSGEASINPITNNVVADVENAYYDVACVADAPGADTEGTGMQADEMKTTDFAALLTSNATAWMNASPDAAQLYAWEIQANENNGYPVFGAAIEAGGWWTSPGNYDSSWYDESLSEFDLSSPEQLAGLAYLVNQGHTFQGKSISLTNDIDLAGLKWEPIGTTALAFRGTFDGGGYEIHNLQCEIISDQAFVAGLFGQIEQATLSNIVLADDCTVTGEGLFYAGGIVAYAYLSNIISCVNRAGITVEGPRGYVGGIAGYLASSEIDRCENQGIIYAEVKNTGMYQSYYTWAGGIAGYIWADEQEISVILNSCNSAAVTVDGVPQHSSYVGGIAGGAEGYTVAVWNNYNTADISLNGTGYAGGIVGDNAAVYPELQNCYNVGAVSTTEGEAYPITSPIDAGENLFYVENCVNAGESLLGVPKSAEEMKTEAFAAGLNAAVTAHNTDYAEAWNFLYWKVDPELNDGYPVFTEQDPGYTAVESATTHVRVYPTAVSGNLYVEGAESTIYLYDLGGHTVSVTEPVEATTVVDMSGLAKGVYLVRTGDRVVRVIKL